MKSKDIIVILHSKGVALDVQESSGKTYYSDTLLKEFRANPYKALLYFGFTDKKPEMSVSLSFLHDFCRGFVKTLSRDPDIEITRSARTPETEEFLGMLHRAPYVVGAENLSVDWFAAQWEDLAAVFEQEISNWDGRVAAFLNAHNPALSVAGRVFFHLVENKSPEYPFAFLATYSTKTAGEKRAVHVPLKNALIEYKDQRELLLKLLSAVSRPLIAVNLFQI